MLSILEMLSLQKLLNGHTKENSFAWNHDAATSLTFSGETPMSIRGDDGGGTHGKPGKR